MRCVSLLCLLSVLFATGPVFAQTAGGRITGLVAEENTGRPLVGANVSVVGTNRGTLTDANGRFILTDVPAGERSVRAGMIGFRAQTRSVQVTAGAATTADFQLQAQAVELEGIVAVGYGTQRARDVTGAVTSVRAEEMRDIPTPNVVLALAGRAPGVDIVRTGYRPGQGMRVRVRGTRSLSGSNDPLYVVDGIPLAGGIQDFNPGDIQSIEILKDASATAIYGSRGANGVVLITTNQGRDGATRITYNTYLGSQQRHPGGFRMMNGQEFATLKREAYRTVGKYNCPDGTVCAAGDQDLFSPAELAGMQNGVSTDWVDLISRNGLQQNHEIGISGGSATTRFSLSANLYDEQGITLGQDYGRRNIGFSLDHTIGRLRAGISGTGSNSVINEGRGDGLWSEALQNNPLGSPWFEDGTLNPFPVPDGQRYNPLLDAQHHLRENTRNRVFGSIFADLEMAEGVNFRMNFGPDLTFRRQGQFRGSLTQARRGGSTDAWLFRDQNFAYTLSNILTANRTMGDHRVNATALYEIQESRFDSTYTAVSELPYEHQKWYNVGSAGTIQGVSSLLREWALQSYMGRVNYGFQDRYLLTLTGRMDGSSRLAEGNKYSFFPSVAAAWRLSEEAFIANTGLFTDLKLRASYGRTGNTAIDPYQTQGGLSRTVYTYGNSGAFGYRPGSLANPALRWETTDQYDVGLDFGILDHRISGAMDFYVQNTYDLLMQRQLPPTSGFNSILENVGETRNTGFELSVSTVNLENWRGLSWRSDISWATNRNEIVSLYGGTADDVGNRWFIGEPINVHYDYKYAGIWQMDQAAEALTYGQRPGQIRVVDVNGDGRIDGADRMILGRHQNFPKWSGSLSNRLTYGSFDLSALATARWGYTVYSNFHHNNNYLFGRYNNMVVNYWTPENPGGTDPRPNADQEFPVYGSTRSFMDGSHVRIRNITLGYNVPDALTGRIGSQSLRVYGTAFDPFIFTNYVGFDPEEGTSAGTPSYRTLLIGASVAF
jgi:TonB-linked SusC/RagA family outer membrane protein